MATMFWSSTETVTVMCSRAEYQSKDFDTGTDNLNLIRVPKQFFFYYQFYKIHCNEKEN